MVRCVHIADAPGGQGRLSVRNGGPLRCRIDGALRLLEEEGLRPLEVPGVEGHHGRFEQRCLPVLDLEIQLNRGIII